MNFKINCKLNIYNRGYNSHHDNNNNKLTNLTFNNVSLASFFPDAVSQ